MERLFIDFSTSGRSMERLFIEIWSLYNPYPLITSIDFLGGQRHYDCLQSPNKSFAQEVSPWSA